MGDLGIDGRVVFNGIGVYEDVAEDRVLCWVLVNKPLDSIQGGKFLDHLTNCYLRKINSGEY
jgi:hypothetical protein